MYTVKEFYLDQLERLKLVGIIKTKKKTIKFKKHFFCFPQDVTVDIAEPTISDEMYKTALKLCIIFDRLDKQEETVNPSSTRSAILIFLPGIYEIDRMYKEIDKWADM